MNYPFGAAYLIENGRSFEIMQRDLANMHNMGFNLVTLWPIANAWLASRPDEFVFSDTRRVLDLCSQLGMQAILQLIGQNPAQEYIPDCLLEPEMMARSEKGVVEDYWTNPNHPRVDALIKGYLQKTVLALKDHPAVFAWDVFNEAHLNTDDPWTMRLYQQWLEKKYGTIGNLNNYWYRRYGDFSQIQPANRSASYSTWSSILPQVDYDLFKSENLAEICKRWCKYIKEVDLEHPVLVDSIGAEILAGDITHRNNNEFAIAEAGDIYGGTFYPKSWGNDLTHRLWELGLRYELSRSAAHLAGKPFSVSELQTHTQSALTPGSEVNPQELTAWIWQGLASEARYIQLWRWRPFLHGYQATGRGLTDIDGTPNQRAEAVRGVVTQINQNAEIFTHARQVDPQVRILVSYRNRLFYDMFAGKESSLYADEIKGWYKLFWTFGLPVSISNLEDLCAEDFESPVLVLPGSLSVTPTTAARLAEYVSKGGMLIADARLGTTDEWGQVPTDKIPGQLLAGIFGFREKDVAGESWFELNSGKCRAAFMTQLLEPVEDAKIHARMDSNGWPAVISHRYGAGESLYISSYLGVSFLKGEAQTAADWLQEHIMAVFPQQTWVQKSSYVHAAFHISGDKRLIYLISTSDEAEKALIHSPLASKRVVDLFTGKPLDWRNPLEVVLEPWETKVICFDK